MVENSKFGFYEFFAGGGMARLGLGAGWQTLLANDFSEKKARAYRLNFPPAHELVCDDVFNLRTEELPSGAAMAWASFPCQDLSLAGKQSGLNGERSGSFWGFWRLIQGLEYEHRPVPLIVLENVVGSITSRGGKDFQVLVQTLVNAGYVVGPMVVNAIHFIPQSRPRLFIVAARRDLSIPKLILADNPTDLWHPEALRRAYHQTPESLREAWIWWRMPKPAPRRTKLADLIEDDPTTVQWHRPEETDRLLELMMPLHREKVKQAQILNRRIVGTIYRRVRQNEHGMKVQCAEVRFDGVSGCLRTGSGGSSRQFIMVVEGDVIRSRLLSPREAARLMGVPEKYKLPDGYNEAYHLMGDGLVVPVVSWIERHLLSPLLGAAVPVWSDMSSSNGNDVTCSALEFVQPSLLEMGASRI